METRRTRKTSKTAKPVPLDDLTEGLSEIRLIPIGDLSPDPENARSHDRRSLDSIKQSLTLFRQQKPVVADSNLVVRAGNGIYLAALELGYTHLLVRVSSLPADKLKAFALADNRTAELSTWNDEALARDLRYLAALDAKLIVGFSTTELSVYTAEAVDSSGELLRKLKLGGIGDPVFKVKRHEVFSISRHLLVVADPITEVKVWQPLLRDAMLFFPFPGPFAAMVERASESSALLVQPDAWIAGHILDRWAEAYGKKQIKKLKP
jgi:hypothetical protein